MRRTKEDAEKTKVAILEAAEQLFLKKGVSKTSLEEIAKSAGMTRGAVYWHFKNKDHLIDELMGQIFQPIDQIFDRFMNTEGTVIYKLFGLFKNIFDRLSTDVKVRNIFTILLRRCEYTEELSSSETVCNQRIEQFISHCAELIGQPETACKLRPDITPDLAAHMLHIMTTGILNDWARNPETFNVNYNPDAVIRAFFKGIFIDWEGL